MKIGDLVKYAWDVIPRRNNSDCGIWEWRTALVVDFPSPQKVALLYKGKIYIVNIKKIQGVVS